MSTFNTWHGLAWAKWITTFVVFHNTDIASRFHCFLAFFLSSFSFFFFPNIFGCAITNLTPQGRSKIFAKSPMVSGLKLFIFLFEPTCCRNWDEQLGQTNPNWVHSHFPCNFWSSYKNHFQCQSEYSMSLQMNVCILAIVLTTTSRMGSKFWTWSPMSFQHMSIKWLFLYLHPTTHQSNIGIHWRYHKLT